MNKRIIRVFAIRPAASYDRVSSGCSIDCEAEYSVNGKCFTYKITHHESTKKDAIKWIKEQGL